MATEEKSSPHDPVNPVSCEYRGRRQEDHIVRAHSQNATSNHLPIKKNAHNLKMPPERSEAP